MLEIRAVTKRFAGIPVVDHVSFEAPAGQITGYLGPNGSGKSTTIKMITGLLAPRRQRYGYVPEEAHLYQHLTGEGICRWRGNCAGSTRAASRRTPAGCCGCSRSTKTGTWWCRPTRKGCAENPVIGSLAA